MANQREMLYLFERIRKEYALHRAAWFGGSYIDAGGRLCLLIAEAFGDCADIREIRALLEREGEVCFRTVKNSRRFLEQCCREALEAAADSPAIAGAGICEERNTVTLAVRDKAAVPERFCGRAEFELAEFGGLRRDAELSPAGILTNGKCFFSAGYPVKDSGGAPGIVTAGHLSGIAAGMEISAAESRVGTVAAFENSRDMDAALIRLDEGCRCTDRILVPPGAVIGDLAPECLGGAGASMYSGTAGCAFSGKVAYPKFDFLDNRGIMVFTYIGKGGDSGAPVLLSGSGREGLIGIHLGTLFLDGKVYSFGRQAREINERFSLSLETGE